MKSKRILVIDDCPEFRSLLTLLLRRNYLVSVAAGGSEGFFKAIEYPPDLVVLDMIMPGWSGLRTLQAFRNHTALRRIPIIVASADASRETVIAAVQAGADDYVLKTNSNLDEIPLKVARFLGLPNPDERNRAATAGVGAEPAKGQGRPIPDERNRAVPLPASHLSHAAKTGVADSADEQTIIDGWD